jgi:hypothetical protein
MRSRFLPFSMVAALAVSAASADDKWELGGGGQCANDDTNVTCNELWPGVRQTHDLQGLAAAPDQDWMLVESKAGRSYEVRLTSANLALNSPVCTTACVPMDRVNAAGAVQTAGVAPNGAGPANGGTGTSLVARWMATADQRDWIRVRGDQVATLTANDQYDIELLDTTYFVPRWNQSGSQTTVFLVQNTSPAAVTGNIRFYDTAGALLHTEPLTVPRNGLRVFPVGSVPALVGQGGSAAIVHTGGFGALAGKAVALEPSTGFTFDTLIVPMQH